MSILDPRPRRLPWEAPIRPARRPFPWLRVVGVGVLVAAVGVVGLTAFHPFADSDAATFLDRELVCHEPVEYPGKLPTEVVVDPALQAFATDLLSRHRTVLTMAFAMDLRTGRPLFLATRSGTDPVGHDLTLLTAPRYPFASLAKILTSAAAISYSGLEPNSPTWLRGHPHTLYKSQLKPDNTGVEIPLVKAFALSINPVFGKLGTYQLGSRVLLDWADSLGFNRPRGLGNGVPSGHMLAPVDSYNLAEISSGFVRTTLGSPVQAAMISRKFASDGRFAPPAWKGFQPDSLCGPDTTGPDPLRRRMLELFRATVDSGTARGGFAAAWPVAERNGFEMGGKTGSLDGKDPPGRYEWFTGYARLEGEPDSGVAITVVTVNDNRGALSASWTAATLLAAWSRRFDQLSPAISVSQALETGRAMYTSDDTDALSERAWHRPWNPRKKKVRRKRS